MTSSDPTKELCLHELFEEQARRSPRATAVEDTKKELTYEELDRRADQLAGYLRSLGVRPDEVVGVYMEHRAEYVVALLAALKAGGAFLPLEVAYPDSLLGDVLADSEPRVVLTQERLAERLPEAQGRFCMDDGWEERLPADSLVENASEPGPDSLVFVAYSSGTTGKPKGIANPHRAAVGSYLWRLVTSDYGPGDRVGCNVFFIWEVFRPLLRGAASVIIPDDVIYDPAALIGFLQEREITETLMTPSLLEAVLAEGGAGLEDRLSTLKTLWLNGEVVTKTLARRAMSLLPRTRLLNAYSVSETHEAAAGDVRELVENPTATYCPVGRPVDPDRLYVLDDNMDPVPEGEAGELYVGGDLLARGYLKLPEKTAERFVGDPFSDEKGARMYRSGDRARLLSDGSLEILGRVDSMQKIRGYSVELGAVETAIEDHLAVNNCVAVVEGEEGEDKRLVAYLVPSEPGEGGGRYEDWEIDPATGRAPGIRERLQESLPHYMIPSVFVEIGSLPLQETTGKVDRRRLPPPPARTAPDRSRTVRAVSADASRPEKEASLTRMWEEILGLEEGDVRGDDDFFDVGGHSLAAAELMGRVDEAFGVRPSVGAFLENPTMAGLCDAIEALQRGGKDGQRAPGPAANPTPDLPDLHAEAVLDPAVVPEGRECGGISLRDAKNVFLTGATGFLGAFLLDALLSRTGARVHCLVRAHEGGDPLAAIRANLERYGLWKPEADPARRVVPVAGDLSEPLLGMAEDDFGSLAREADVVIHAGASVNLIYPYPALKPANVGGTHEILRLACLHKTKPVHHVSTNGIFPPEEGRCLEDADLDALAGAREDGYGCSKWVAEKLAREAAGRGLLVSVYRPGNISGHSESGASNARDFLTALIAESLRTGVVPEIEGWRMEMTPVDFVARAICHIADEPEASGRVFHLADPDPVPASTVFAWLEDMGYPLDRLPYAEWLEAWRTTPRTHADDAIGGVLHGTDPETDTPWDDNTYDDRNTRQALRGGGPRRPAVDAALIGTYARYFADRGWVEAPPALADGRRGERRGERRTPA